VRHATDDFEFLDRPPPSSTLPGRESGFTLIEMLIAVMITGLIATAVLGALGTVVRATAKSDDKSRMEAVMSSAADRLSVASFIPCATKDSYSAQARTASGTVGWGPDSVIVESVTYWNSATSSFGATCNVIGQVSPVQKVKVKVQSPDGKTVRYLEVVKSDVLLKYS
jgi:prepilin-type N-terminal cleavage/methylation domain-containing protein